jgi:hypothetical protein
MGQYYTQNVTTRRNAVAILAIASFAAPISGSNRFCRDEPSSIGASRASLGGRRSQSRTSADVEAIWRFAPWPFRPALFGSLG